MANQYIFADVTQEDIDKGECSNPNLCPLARGVSRAFPRNPLVIVSAGRAMVYTDKGLIIYGLSRAARNFMYRFDNQKSVTPAKFRLQKIRDVEG